MPPLGAHQSHQVQPPQIHLQVLLLLRKDRPRRAPGPIPVAALQPGREQEVTRNIWSASVSSISSPSGCRVGFHWHWPSEQPLGLGRGLGRASRGPRSSLQSSAPCVPVTCCGEQQWNLTKSWRQRCLHLEWSCPACPGHSGTWLGEHRHTEGQGPWLCLPSPILRDPGARFLTRVKMSLHISISSCHQEQQQQQRQRCEGPWPHSS